MEGDRNAYTEENGLKLAKQRRVITTLNKEKHNLLNDYKTTISDKNKKIDRAATAKVNILLSDQEKIQTRIKKTKASIEELDYQIIKVLQQFIPCTNFCLFIMIFWVPGGKTSERNSW